MLRCCRDEWVKMALTIEAIVLWPAVHLLDQNVLSFACSTILSGLLLCYRQIFSENIPRMEEARMDS